MKNNLTAFSSVLQESYCILRDSAHAHIEVFLWCVSLSKTVSLPKLSLFLCSFCDQMPNCTFPFYEIRILDHYLT